VPSIDLTRHAAIEASAGTGKTHQIEELVIRLLSERVPLEEILVVTYTEKATGELKSRLRDKLEEAIDDIPLTTQYLQRALDHFDQAQIHTIHGFCQRVLQDYAFENRHDFQAQLVRDAEVMEVCLREIQRTDWPSAYGEALASVLALADFNADKRGAERWEKRVRELAERFRPACDHEILPLPHGHGPEELQGLEAEAQQLRQRLRQLAGDVDAQRLEEHGWHVGYGDLTFNRRNRDAWRRDLLLPLLGWLADDRGRALASFQQLLPSIKKDPEVGFRKLIDLKKRLARQELPVKCPNLCEAVEALEAFRRKVDWTALNQRLLVDTLHRLQERVVRYKHERGLHSFEDMLTRLDDALDPRNPRAAALLAGLRRHYRYAIVDEFQDTDPIQWRIFKRIFVDGADRQRLFVVGDPKQAIFAFRGADVEAYRAARTDLLNLDASRVSLEENWRSCPELLRALNRLFMAGNWFAGDNLDYTEVRPPEPRRPSRVVEDETGRPALTLVDVSRPTRLARARRDYAGFVASEIQRLLSRPFEFEIDGEAATLQPGDICVLVFKRREADPVVEALREAGIPFTFYKQTGLWQSAEALHLGYLLRALTRPGEIQSFRKALLTRFFRVAPEKLTGADELSPAHPIKELFHRWYGLAEKRAWAELFQSILEETGILFQETAAEADRARANYRHLTQTLEAAGYERDLDLLGILEVFDGLRRRAGPEEGDLQPVESERPRVQIMTVHASKGLEFPVVFLAGGFTNGRKPDYYTYHPEQAERKRLVFDLRDDPDARRQHYRERSAEERRLLYVALTRARFKVYVPLLSTETTYAGRGPLATILAPALQTSQVAALGKGEAGKIDPDSPAPMPAGGGRQAADPRAASRGRKTPETPRTLAGELFPRLDADLPRRRIVIRSFSSLHRQLAAPPGEGPRYVEREPRADDDVRDPIVEAPLRGPVFGDMVHDAIAEIDFAAVGRAPMPEALLKADSPTREWIDQVVGKHSARLLTRLGEEELRETGRNEVARLIWNALHTPLSAVGGPLCQIPEADRLHELEFHFPTLLDELPPEIGREESFLTGFMDLVFRKADRYFLVDWKTNLLAGYAPDAVRRSMQDCDYVRQYRLYVQALARWLRSRRGADARVAGVYYLFLRGLNGRDETSGVYFHEPRAEDFELKGLGIG
jgi:exodeoxyribonuclease V beta subunit